MSKEELKKLLAEIINDYIESNYYGSRNNEIIGVRDYLDPTQAEEK